MNLFLLTQFYLKMVRWSLLLIFFLFYQKGTGQRDSLSKALANASEDSTKIAVLVKLADTYRYTSSDTLIMLTKKAAELALKKGYVKDYANALIRIANAYTRTGDTSNALAHYRLALQTYQEHGIEEGTGSTLNNIGTLYYQSSAYREALEYFKRSLTIREKLNNKRNLAGTTNNMGGAYKELGNYVLALEYFLKGLAFSEELHDTALTITSSINIAGIYQYTGNTDKAVEYGTKALRLSRSSADPSAEVFSLIIIGAAYDKKEAFKQAEDNYRKALTIALSINDLSNIADCYISLAHIYTQKKNYAEGIAYYQKGMAYAEKINDQLYIAQAYEGMGKICMLQQKYPDGIRYFEKALNLAKDAEMKAVMATVLGSLSDAYSYTGQYQKAYDHLLLYLSYKDSVLDENGKQKIQQLQFDYELLKKQQEILLLNQEKAFQDERNSRQKLLTLSLGIILFMSVLMIIFLFYARKKDKLAKAVISEQKMEIQLQANHLKELNELKTRTFTVICHDLRSPIASLSMLMDLMNEKVLSTDQFEEAVSSVNKQLDALIGMLENLLVWSKSQMQGQSETKPAALRVDTLIKQNISLLQEQARQKAISLYNSTPADLVAYADGNQIDIVVRNLLSNAIKFTKENGSVTVTSSDEGDKIKIEVRDTGTGMSEEKLSKLFDYTKNFTSVGTKGEIGTGLGLLLCKEFIEKNGGNIFVTSEPGKGSAFFFTLPKDNSNAGSSAGLYTG
jgi:signal transduction histidine kinase/Flp pilus assembly protein TadD